MEVDGGLMAWQQEMGVAMARYICIERLVQKQEAHEQREESQEEGCHGK